MVKIKAKIKQKDVKGWAIADQYGEIYGDTEASSVDSPFATKAAAEKRASMWNSDEIYSDASPHYVCAIIRSDAIEVEE